MAEKNSPLATIFCNAFLVLDLAFKPNTLNLWNRHNTWWQKAEVGTCATQWVTFLFGSLMGGWSPWNVLMEFLIGAKAAVVCEQFMEQTWVIVQLWVLIMVVVDNLSSILSDLSWQKFFLCCNLCWQQNAKLGREKEDEEEAALESGTLHD